MAADTLPNSQEKLLAEIGILQNNSRLLIDYIKAQKEVINQLQNAIQSYQKSNHTYLHSNLGGNTTESPSNNPKTVGETWGETLQKLPETLGETEGKTLAVLQLASTESSPKSFLQYNQNLEPLNTDFSQKEKNQLLEKIQEIENEIQDILQENCDNSANEDLDEYDNNFIIGKQINYLVLIPSN